MPHIFYDTSNADCSFPPNKTVTFYFPFVETREYIKREINRSDDREYYYWKHELKMLYIEHIPILGWFIRRFKR